MASITKFVTFYSYKGGVGRTSALVNSAILRAKEGNRVLLIDFDLEAPGLGSYLKRLDTNYDPNRIGLLEYLHDAIYSPRVPSLVSSAFDLSSVVDRNGGSLLAINAGDISNPHYSAKLEALNWSEIFKNRAGELVLKNLKRQIAAEFDNPDYVFIDSRTGITETGGVCTRYLADTVVLLTSLNAQNINGTSIVYDSLRRTKDIILVVSNVPAGMPQGKGQLFQERIESLHAKLNKTPDVCIYYYPLLSLDEALPSTLLSRSENKENSGITPDPLLQSYKKLAQIIDRKNGDSFLKLLASASREFYRFGYEGTEEGDSTSLAVLKNSYATRPLAKALIELADMFRACQAQKDVSLWDHEKFRRIRSEVAGFSNQSVRSVLDETLRFLTAIVRHYLKSEGRMTAQLETFLFSEAHHSISLIEIAKGNYDWPIDSLSRVPERSEDLKPLPEAMRSYNLAHCLQKIGNVEDARGNFERFLSLFPQLPIEKVPAIQQANWGFCAGLAASFLGKYSDAEAYLDFTRKSLALISAEDKVFSPIQYKEVLAKEFEVELERVFLELKGVG